MGEIGTVLLSDELGFVLLELLQKWNKKVSNLYSIKTKFLRGNQISYKSVYIYVCVCVYS